MNRSNTLPHPQLAGGAPRIRDLRVTTSGLVWALCDSPAVSAAAPDAPLLRCWRLDAPHEPHSCALSEDALANLCSWAAAGAASVGEDSAAALLARGGPLLAPGGALELRLAARLSATGALSAQAAQAVLRSAGSAATVDPSAAPAAVLSAVAAHVRAAAAAEAGPAPVERTRAAISAFGA